MWERGGGVGAVGEGVMSIPLLTIAAFYPTGNHCMRALTGLAINRNTMRLS